MAPNIWFMERLLIFSSSFCILLISEDEEMDEEMGGVFWFF
jgi:hypothetical protein